jgi:hypothetical protein
MFSCGQVAAHLETMARGGLNEQLEEMVGVVIGRSVERAKGYIGHQQESWPELSSATIEGFHHELGFWIKGKRELGFSGPDYQPLERSGQLRESYSGFAEGLMGVLGSDDRVALYQEMGTPNARYPIPPRPVCALAIMESVPDVDALSEGVFAVALMPTG